LLVSEKEQRSARSPGLTQKGRRRTWSGFRQRDGLHANFAASKQESKGKKKKKTLACDKKPGEIELGLR